jgi:hypothetical protein
MTQMQIISIKAKLTKINLLISIARQAKPEELQDILNEMSTKIKLAYMELPKGC